MLGTLGSLQCPVLPAASSAIEMGFPLQRKELNCVDPVSKAEISFESPCCRLCCFVGVQCTVSPE